MNPTEYLFELPHEGRPQDVSIPEVWYPGIRATWDRCTTRRIVDPIFGIRAVVIHATAGASSEGAVSVMREGKASFHWLVPDENEAQHGQIVWACAPEARAAWHVRNDCSDPAIAGGADKVNHWSVGIEVVNTQQQDPFSDWQVAATAQIVRCCWAKYPNLQYVVSHARLDPRRRSDPGVQFPWSRFAAQVLDAAQDVLPTVARAARDAALLPAFRGRAAAAHCCMGPAH